MHLRRWGSALALAWLCGAPGGAQDSAPVPGEIDVDILFNYYEQDGDRSPVTGGVGTEKLDVISPVVVVRWSPSGVWKFDAQLGVDQITSASTDNMDLGEAVVSSASRMDARAYSTVSAARSYGASEVKWSLGLSSEYDYLSVMGGVDWSRSFRQQNTTLAASLRYYQDTVELYEIDGVKRGQDSRQTANLDLTWTELLGPRTVASAELSVSAQSGFLSTPFYEVILAPTAAFPQGEHVAERLPDSRLRYALGLRLNHSFSKHYVQRLYYRWYSDDWGITSSSIEVEPWFRLPTEREAWVYPIYRYHDQTAADYFGIPESFEALDPYATADPDLAEFTSQKVGVGFRLNLGQAGGTRGRLRFFESRVTSYSRDDGLDALSISVGQGLRF